MASPTKLAHVVLWTRQVPRMRDWYVKVLEARVVHENPDAVFLTYDEEHHRIALTHPDGAARLASELFGQSEGLIGTGGQATGEVSRQDLAKLPLHGLSHIAFTHATHEGLLENYDRLKKESILPTVTINHGTTTSMYYADPDGNQIELQVDNFDTIQEVTEYMESEAFARNPIGVPFDPDELFGLIKAGESAVGLVKPTW